MSDLVRIHLQPDYRVRLARVLPGVTEADLAVFDQMLLADAVVLDDGAPHPVLLAWLQEILDRGEFLTGLEVRPVGPRPAPAGAMIGGAV